LRLSTLLLQHSMNSPWWVDGAGCFQHLLVASSWAFYVLKLR
jgi:threonine/homoserine efflux transporter RhtA